MVSNITHLVSMSTGRVTVLPGSGRFVDWRLVSGVGA